MSKNFIVLILTLIIIPCIIIGQIPQTISYQGILSDTNGIIVPDGEYDLIFNIYDVSTGGSAIWTETQSVQVTEGIFNVILGQENALEIPFNVPSFTETPSQ